MRTTIYEYLQRLMLQMREQQDKEKEEERVSLMTMHSAKGLEFDTVFLAGVEDHIIPHRRTIEENEKALEEERRLFYVAITRAKKTALYILCETEKGGQRLYDDISLPIS